MRYFFILSAFLVLALAGCSGEGTFTTDVFSLSVTGSNADITEGTFSKSVALSKVLFKQAVDQATEEFKQVPSSFKVREAKIDLDPSQSSISAYEQVFSDTLTFSLIPTNGSGVDVGEKNGLAGNEEFEVKISAKPEDFSADLTTFLNGDFSIGIRGATGGTNAANFNAFLTVMIQYEFFK